MQNHEDTFWGVVDFQFCLIIQDKRVSTLNDNLLKACDSLFSSGPPVGLGLKGDSFTLREVPVDCLNIDVMMAQIYMQGVGELEMYKSF